MKEIEDVLCSSFQFNNQAIQDESSWEALSIKLMLVFTDRSMRNSQFLEVDLSKESIYLSVARRAYLSSPLEIVPRPGGSNSERWYRYSTSTVPVSVIPIGSGSPNDVKHSSELAIRCDDAISGALAPSIGRYLNMLTAKTSLKFLCTVTGWFFWFPDSKERHIDYTRRLSANTWLINALSRARTLPYPNHSFPFTPNPLTSFTRHPTSPLRLNC